MEYTLRKWDESDAPSIARYANNKRIADNLRDGFPHPYTLDDAYTFIRDMVDKGDNGQIARTIEVAGQAVGSIGVFFGTDVYRKSAELGYWLAEPYWGRGIMPRAVTELCGYVFAHYDIVRIYAEPYAHNTGSRRVLEKAGFALEGILKNSVYKNEQLHDSCIYTLLV